MSQHVPSEVLSILKDLTPLQPTDPSKVLHIGIGLQPAHEAELEAFCDQVSNPRSPLYHHFLTPQEVGKRFGATQAQVEAAVAFLKQSGMKVTLVAPNRMEVLADATVAQVESAFNTSLSDFETQHPLGTGKFQFYANTKPATVPASLAGFVIDISGLDSYARGRPLGTTTYLTPPQTQGLYNTVPMEGGGYNGQGVNVGITSFVGYRLAQVPLFVAAYGLPVPGGGAGSNITVVVVDGGSGTGAENDEGDLDIQMVLSNAPLCNLYIYDAPFTGGGLIDVLTKEASDNLASILTESYGWGLSGGDADSCHNQHLAMTANGQTYMHATGDSGANIHTYPYPDIDPEPLGVGGTAATADSTTGARVAEVGWSGSGGGWDTNGASWNKLPSWQKGNGVPTTINYRLQPDVALHASGGAGGCFCAYYFFGASGNPCDCGTSFACPVFAGCLATVEQRLIAGGQLAGNRFGRVQDLIYLQNGNPFVWYDVTSGTNGTLPDGSTGTCGVGWDFVTGWGAPDFTALMTSQLIPTTTTPSGAPNPSQYNEAVVLSAAVSPTPGGGTVTFKDGSTTLGTVNVGNTLAHTFTGLGSHTITANYSGDLSDAASSGSYVQVVNQATTTTTIAANPNPGVVGQNVVITPTVSPTPDGGTIAIKDDGAPIGTVPVGGSLTWKFTTAKTHHLTADYSGDAHYVASSGSLDLVVGKAPTTTTVAAVPNPGVVRQAITITPTVTPTPDGGTIDIKDDGTLIGTVPLGGSLTWKFNTAKIHVIEADYSGDANYFSSTGSTNLEIDKAPTQTTLTATPPVGATGNPTTLHAVVICTVDNNPPDPPGTVDFVDLLSGLLDLGTEPMGTDLTYTFWFAGTHPLEARYSGNDNFLPSTGKLSYAIVPHLLPNLYWNGWMGEPPGTPIDPRPYRPEVVYVDGVTLHDILNYNGVTIDPNLIIQAVEVSKVTPSLKCTAFVSGPGAGLNTNFDTGLRKATDADIDSAIVNLAFGIPQGQVALGNRALLFSPPGTTYTLSVVYVVLDSHGRPGVPKTVTRVLQLIVPSRDDLRKEVEYFSTVAAGATQKPKITDDVVTALNAALDKPADLDALLAWETVVANSSILFTDLLAKVDDRFVTDYLIDDDEEPIGCLLIEQANVLLWH